MDLDQLISDLMLNADALVILVLTLLLEGKTFYIELREVVDREVEVH